MRLTAEMNVRFARDARQAPNLMVMVPSAAA